MVENTLQMNQLTVDRRIVLPPMATAQSTAEGYVTPEFIHYYEDRAKNPNVGLIIIEHGFPCPEGRASKGQLSYAEEGVLPGLTKLTAAVHACGKPLIAQINHAGSGTTTEITGCEVYGPSAIGNPGRKAGVAEQLPVAMDEDIIQKTTEDFVKAARRAQEAGFDGVEIHCAHGYLLNQFYSPITNKRTDRYGCDSLENRLRLTLEVVKAVREAVGDLFLAVRLGGCDYMEGGSTISDAVEAGKLLEEAGVDLIDLTGGMCRFNRPDNTAPGYFSDMSKAVKAAVKVPVLVTGGVKTLADAEMLLADESADLIGVGRALLKDAMWEV